MRVYPSQEKITVNHDSQPLLLNSNNPYVTNENEPLLQNPISRISIPSDLINKAIQVEKLTCPVKVICICDIFMNIYYFFVNPIICGVLCIVSINGYLATIYYKRSLMFCYLIYQYLQVCGRLTTLVIAIDYAVQPVSNTTTTTNNTMVALYNPVVSPILLGVMLLLQIYIAYFVTKFYKLLPNKEELERVRFTII